MSLSFFAGEALTDLKATAALAPSSRYLVRAMVEPLPLIRSRTVIELGPGTGVMTRTLLDALPGDGKLFAFEINQRFVDYIRSTIHDPRLEVVARGAEHAADEMRRRGIRRADAVLSSLGLGNMSQRDRDKLFERIQPLFDHETVFTQFQYPNWFDARRLLRRYFSSVNRRIILRNLPPAFVYECRDPR